MLICNCTNRETVVTVVEAPPTRVAAMKQEAQIVRVTAVEYRTAPIVAVQANVAERTVVVVAIARGRQKNRVTGVFIGKFPAVYTI